MATTTDWFPAWLARHLDRHAMAGLPDPTKKFLFYEAWRDEFARVGMTEFAAEQASKLLTAKSGYKSAHFATLCKLAWEVRRATSPAQADELASKNCLWCEGSGYAHVRDRDTGTNWSAHCICPLGTRYLRKAQREAKSPTAQFIDLAAIKNGQTYRVMHMGRAVTLDFTEDVAWQASLNEQESYA